MPFDVTSDLSDESLLAGFASGDTEAARALTRRLSPRVMAQAWRMLGSQAEAEDVTQEAMLRLWKIAPEWRHGEAKVTTWLYRVVANLCTDRLRRARSVGLEAAPEVEDSAASPAEHMQDQARATALHQALAALPDRQRQAVSLRHLDGLSNPEVAEAMGISVEAVESLTSRGRRALTQALRLRQEELGYQDG